MLMPDDHAQIPSRMSVTHILLQKCGIMEPFIFPFTPLVNYDFALTLHALMPLT